MQRIILLMSLIFATLTSVVAQDNLNMNKLANVKFGENGNDIWGFVDANGIEYAVMGTRNATQILSLEDPTNPILRASIVGASSVWRDMKSWKTHIYVTTDQGTDGLLIIDMSEAPDKITHHFWKPSLTIGNATDVLQKCHNIYIDEFGYAYLAGCNVGGGGPIFLDLNQDLDNPIHVGQENKNYAHDVFVEHNRLYASDIYRGELSIWDVSDKSNPIELARQETTSKFTHNAWASSDGKYAFTTDERGRGKLDAYDITDLNNIIRTDAFRPAATEAFDVIPHNAHYLNGYLIVSWYTSGVVVVDAHRPENLIEVANFDSYAGPDGGFSGCWGAYPFLPSGLILSSDINSGLYVLGVDYKRACYLEGEVSEKGSNATINEVDVKIVSNLANFEKTNLFGEYKTGLADAGSYTVTFLHPDYLPLTMDNIELKNGEVTELDVKLVKRQQVSIKGRVIDAKTKMPIAKANISMVNDLRSTGTKADNNGEFEMLAFLFNGPSQIVAGSWGYLHNSIDHQLIVSDTTFVIELDLGYQDDFIFDQGWNLDSKAGTGSWVRDIPVGTFNQNDAVNVDEDVQSDYGLECYVTGNGGGGIGADDVDNGITSFSSPVMDLTEYKDPMISFRTWFVNFGGNSDPDDTLKVYLSNGTDEMMIYELSTSFSGWNDSTIIRVKDFMQPEMMTIRFETSDINPTGHIVEAGIDEFRVTDQISTSTRKPIVERNAFDIYPNPFDNEWTLKINSTYLANDKSIEIYGMDGRRVWSRILNANQNSFTFNFPLQSGTYIAKLTIGQNVISSKTIIKN